MISTARNHFLTSFVNFHSSNTIRMSMELVNNLNLIKISFYFVHFSVKHSYHENAFFVSVDIDFFESVHIIENIFSFSSNNFLIGSCKVIWISCFLLFNKIFNLFWQCFMEEHSLLSLHWINWNLSFHRGCDNLLIIWHKIDTHEATWAICHFENRGLVWSDVPVI